MTTSALARLAGLIAALALPAVARRLHDEIPPRLLRRIRLARSARRSATT